MSSPLMETGTKQSSIWEFRTRSGHERKGQLVAYWEVSLDPVSDDYTPAEIMANDLFDEWVRHVRGKYPNELVPISWFVQGEEAGVFEYMPFQFDHFQVDENFLTFFAWPIHATTGEPLNWLMLSVVDKLWNARGANKGGFIQEATGWKPAILQPFVYLPALVNASAAG